MRLIACRACAGLLFAALLFPVQPAGFQATSQPRQPVGLGVLLASYADGDVGAALTFATQLDKVRALRSFDDQARRWIDADRAGAASRRLTAATFVLDVARHWVRDDDWQYARPLIAWGCAQLRVAPTPAPAERLWHLAAVAIAEGADDWPFLAGRVRSQGRPVPAGRNPLETEMAQGHLSHAVARFPGEPRLALAESVLAENRTWEVGGFGRDLNLRGSISVGEIDSDYVGRLRSGNVVAEDGSNRTIPNVARIAQSHLSRVGELHELRARYQALTRQPALAAEAHLRLALVTFRLAERDEALRHLQTAQELARDPHIVYLVHLFTGAIRDRQGLDEQAIDAYRSALNIVPRAQSATSLLVARLFAVGRQAEAAVLADAFFAGGDPPVDPWRLYRFGDFRLLPGYLAQLRAEAK
jgi:tetratricopeptide (TPR) repeat protein